MEWSFEDARDRLDELLDRVESDGPQRIQRRGRRFLLSVEEYEEENQLVRAFLDGPSWEGVIIERIKEKMRDIEFQVVQSTYLVTFTVPTPPSSS